MTPRYEVYKMGWAATRTGASMPGPRHTKNFGLARKERPILEAHECIPLIRLAGEGIHLLTRDEYRFYVEMGLWRLNFCANWDI